jgi:signal transduction histidine kinase
MGRLVSDLLLLAQADAGQHLTLQTLDIGAVGLAVARSARALRPDVQIDVVGDWDGLWVRGDADRLRQVLLILVDNALKVTPPGGRVTLGAARQGEAIVLSVIDSGPGIAVQERSRIFDRFYRRHRARSGEGTGLGLVIARWIVDEHNGRIEVVSIPGAGATFRVHLPSSVAIQPDFSIQAA